MILTRRCARCAHEKPRHGSNGCTALARDDEGNLISYRSAIPGLILYAECECPVYVKPAPLWLRVLTRLASESPRRRAAFAVAAVLGAGLMVLGVAILIGGLR